jgi:hypothetical protein
MQEEVIAMSQEQDGVALAARPMAGWPPDDTEESVVGTNLHQTTITNLRWGLNEVASLRPPAGQAPPWQALSQTAVSGMRRPDGSSYTVLPDVFVYRQPIDERLATLALEDVGPPLLVIEVLSKTTYRSDLDFRSGKGFSYAQAGVQEYLILDPTGEFLPERVLGSFLGNHGYVRRRPDASGRWRSRELALGIAFEGALIAVYAGDGKRQLREGEVAREIARRDDEIARRDDEIAALRRLLDQQRKAAHD